VQCTINGLGCVQNIGCGLGGGQKMWGLGGQNTGGRGGQKGCMVGGQKVWKKLGGGVNVCVTVGCVKVCVTVGWVNVGCVGNPVAPTFWGAAAWPPGMPY